LRKGDRVMNQLSQMLQALSSGRPHMALSIRVPGAGVTSAIGPRSLLLRPPPLLPYSLQ